MLYYGIRCFYFVTVVFASTVTCLPVFFHFIINTEACLIIGKFVEPYLYFCLLIQNYDLLSYCIIYPKNALRTF